MHNASPHDIEQARARIEAARAELENLRAAEASARAAEASARAELMAAREALAKHAWSRGTSRLPLWLQTTLLYLLLLTWPVALVLAIVDFGRLSLVFAAINSLISLALAFAHTKPIAR